MSSDRIAALQERGWIPSTMEGMWEHPERIGGPVSLPEALEVEFGGQGASDSHNEEPEGA